jgi:hypothetical protein
VQFQADLIPKTTNVEDLEATVFINVYNMVKVRRWTRSFKNYEGLGNMKLPFALTAPNGANVVWLLVELFAHTVPVTVVQT